MSSVTLNGDTSGSVLLQAPAIAGSTTINIAAQSGTLNVAGPTFSAYRASNQSLSAGTNTKIQINTESWDTANCFDTTNNRFTPNVAGYYHLNGSIAFTNAVSGYATLSFYKNGTIWASCSEVNLVTSSYNALGGTCLVYLNGTTDYVELWAVTNGASTVYGDAGNYTFFQGCWMRGA